MSKVVPITNPILQDTPIQVDTSTLDKEKTKDKEEDKCSLFQILGIFLVISNLVYVIRGVFTNRPSIKNRLHEACMWESGYYQKFHCSDIGKSECVPLKTVYPDPDQDPFQYIIKDNPQDFDQGLIEWQFGEVSICMCLDGYDLHSGSCRPSLTKWYDPSIIWIIVCSIILLFVPSSKNPQVYLIVCILLFIWGVNLATSLQIEYSRYC